MKFEADIQLITIDELHQYRKTETFDREGLERLNKFPEILHESIMSNIHEIENLTSHGGSMQGNAGYKTRILFLFPASNQNEADEKIIDLRECLKKDLSKQGFTTLESKQEVNEIYKRRCKLGKKSES